MSTYSNLSSLPITLARFERALRYWQYVKTLDGLPLDEALAKMAAWDDPAMAQAARSNDHEP